MSRDKRSFQTQAVSCTGSQAAHTRDPCEDRGVSADWQAQAGDSGGAPHAEGPPSPPKRPHRDRVLLLVGLAVVLIVVVVVVVVVIVKMGKPSSQSSSSATSSSASTPSQTACPPIASSKVTSTRVETEGSLGAPSYLNPKQLCGGGPRVPPGSSVKVVCKLYSPVPTSVTPDGYWYLMADGPAKGRFAAANTFLNGDAPGAGDITNTDKSVPDCPRA